MITLRAGNLLTGFLHDCTLSSASREFAAESSACGSEAGMLLASRRGLRMRLLRRVAAVGDLRSVLSRVQQGADGHHKGEAAARKTAARRTGIHAARGAAARDRAGARRNASSRESRGRSRRGGGCHAIDIVGKKSDRHAHWCRDCRRRRILVHAQAALEEETELIVRALVSGSV